MSEAYERIWLQCPNTDPDNEWCGETTWCQDKINDDDVEYVRGDLVESLRQRVMELKEYLREVAVEAGLPPETLDIATCRHIAHQVKSLRLAAYQFMEEAEAERKRRWDGNADSSREIAELSRELAALKAGQGEPVAYGMADTQLGRKHRLMMVRLDKDQDGCNIPLYTAPTIPEGYVMVPIGEVVKSETPRRLYDIKWSNGCPAIGSKLYAAAPKPEE